MYIYYIEDFAVTANKKKNPAVAGFQAGATGFEPAVSALTGPHVKPLHHAPAGDKSLTYSVQCVKNVPSSLLFR